MIPVRGKKSVGLGILPLIIENTIPSTSIIPITTTSTLVSIQHPQIPTIQMRDIDQWIEKRETIRQQICQELLAEMQIIPDRIYGRKEKRHKSSQNTNNRKRKYHQSQHQRYSSTSSSSDFFSSDGNSSEDGKYACYHHKGQKKKRLRDKSLSSSLKRKSRKHKGSKQLLSPVLPTSTFYLF